MITKAEDLDFVEFEFGKISKIAKKDRNFFDTMGKEGRFFYTLFNHAAASFLLENAQSIYHNTAGKALSAHNKLYKKEKTIVDDLDFLRKKVLMECNAAMHSTNLKLIYRSANTAFQGFKNSANSVPMKNSNVLSVMYSFSKIQNIFSQIEETDTTEKNIDTIQDEVVNFLKVHKNEIDSNVLLELANIVNQAIAPFYAEFQKNEKDLEKTYLMPFDKAAVVKYLETVRSYFRKIALLSNKLESAAKQRTTSNWE